MSRQATGPAAQPPAPAASAALILVREAAGRVQVYLLRRSASSGFMPGAFVFPGGLVEPCDGEAGFWRRRVDLAPGEIHRRLGEAGGFDALTYAVAAVREAFEESCALLALSPRAGGGAYREACALRAAGGLEHGWLNRLAGEGDWSLSLSRLSPWERWVTPLAMPRRFDTRFFVAALPQGQRCSPDGRETTQGFWLEPHEALAANLCGAVPLTPPGLATLQELLRYPTLRSLQSAAGRRWSAGVMPRLVPLAAPRQALILMPWDPQYGGEAPGILPGAANPEVLPAGAPFSRVWNDGKGIWRPVR